MYESYVLIKVLTIHLTMVGSEGKTAFSIAISLGGALAPTCCS